MPMVHRFNMSKNITFKEYNVMEIGHLSHTKIICKIENWVNKKRVNILNDLPIKFLYKIIAGNYTLSTNLSGKQRAMGREMSSEEVVQEVGS